MNIYSILFLVILNVYCIGSTPFYWNLMEKRDEPKIYCGSKLHSTLALVCHNQYYTRDGRTPHNFDAFSYDSEYPNGIDGDDKYDSEALYPFLQKSSSLSLLPNKVRRTHGISNECCDKPCTLTDMQAYCG